MGNEKKYIAIKQANDLSPRTIKEYEKMIKKLQSVFNKPIEKITFDEYTKFLNTLSKVTRFNYTVFIKNYYKVLELDLGDFKHLKPRAIKINHVEKKKHLVSEQELNDLINYASPRDKAIIEILYYTGFRVSELTSIKFSDVVIHDDKITVSCNDSKTDTREFPVYDNMPNLENLIKIYHPTKNPNDFLFLTSKKNGYIRINEKSINYNLNQLCIKTDNKHIKPHDFRHTRASILCKQGIPETVIKKLMGWSENSTMLSHYNHNDLKDYEHIIKGTSKPTHTAQYYKQQSETLQSRVDMLEEKLNQVLARI